MSVTITTENEKHIKTKMSHNRLEKSIGIIQSKVEDMSEGICKIDENMVQLIGDILKDPEDQDHEAIKLIYDNRDIIISGVEAISPHIGSAQATLYKTFLVTIARMGARNVVLEKTVINQYDKLKEKDKKIIEITDAIKKDTVIPDEAIEMLKNLRLTVGPGTSQSTSVMEAVLQSRKRTKQ